MARMASPNPHAGGKKIPPATQMAVQRRILQYAAAKYAGKYLKLDLRFKAAFCYIDAYRDPEPWNLDRDTPSGENLEAFLERLRNTPTHLCRLRHFELDKWSVAFFTYSNERYEPCMLPSGEWFGTVEEGFDVGAVYLLD